MTNENYLEFFTTDNKSGCKTKEDKLLKNYPDLHYKIIKYALEINLPLLPFKEKIWFFINNEKHEKICGCGSKVKFKGTLTQGYNKSCSLKCSANSDITKLKYKETTLLKYGVEHPAKSKIIREKYKTTCIDRYGVDNVSKVNEFQEKKEKTNIKKFGVTSVLKLDRVKDKLTEYSMDKYGVPNVNSSNEIKQQKINTLLLNHGVTNPMLSEKFKTKQINTLLLNHDVNNPMKSIELKNKCVNSGIQTKFNSFFNKFENLDELMSWSAQTLTFNCLKCDNTYTLTRELLNLRHSKKRVICTTCNPLYKQDSYSENEINLFITLLDINIIKNNRSILNGKELDIYIPSHNLAIEFDGLYWHNELKISKDYHLNKTELCEKQDIQLIHIFEDEWLHKQDIVKSRLKNILGLTENKIYGRKTIIKEVSPKDSREFLDNNHIQGNVNSKFKLGLYYNDELVSLMTFGKGRLIMGGKDDEIELLRFCNKLDTTVIGGADKLLKHFIKTNKPTKIVSYADRRWSQGSLYQKLGFELIHNSKPNYSYIKNNQRFHRFGFRKSILTKEGYDPNKTEKEIMFERKFYRIYDCGSIRFELNINNHNI